MEYPFVTAIVGLFTLRRLVIYRYVRPLVDPLIVVGLGYRIFCGTPGQVDFLSQFLHEIERLSVSNAKLVGILFLVRDILGVLLLFRIVRAADCILSVLMRFESFEESLKSIAQYGYGFVKNISFVKDILRKEEEKLQKSLEAELKVKSRALGAPNYELPEEGWSEKKILTLMKDATKKEDPVWEEGNVSGAVYHGKRDHIELLNKAFNMYSLANPLHPDIWPSVMKFDAEIISMTASLVRGNNDQVCGATTSGGTESIILAIKAHRDYYYDHYGITEPEMVVGVSAHAAVDKACDLMKIKLIKVDLDPATYRINLRSLENAITPNTIMMYASAPSYPQGSIDPVKEMGKLAIKYNIGLHVDCCLGGFILPFAKQLNMNIPGNLCVLHCLFC